MKNPINIEIDQIIQSLTDKEKYESFYHSNKGGISMPSVEILDTIVQLLKRIIFPGFYGSTEVNETSIYFQTGANIDLVFPLLSEQIKRGFCFSCEDDSSLCMNCEEKSKEIAFLFINHLPQIKQLLSTDVIAAYNGDPAAKSYGETIFCYPSILALTYHRIAHSLLKLEVPLIPRIISEMAHSLTGIDIHPGATIGEYFFIDHGTGVVIGETSVIGNNVRLYQGVTLGAKSFPLDENGKPIKGIPRHPIVEDDVIIYSNATILGTITLGKGCVIGGNMWVTEDVSPNSKVFKK